MPVQAGGYIMLLLGENTIRRAGCDRYFCCFTSSSDANERKLSREFTRFTYQQRFSKGGTEQQKVRTKRPQLASQEIRVAQALERAGFRQSVDSALQDKGAGIIIVGQENADDFLVLGWRGLFHLFMLPRH